MQKVEITEEVYHLAKANDPDAVLLFGYPKRDGALKTYAFGLAGEEYPRLEAMYTRNRFNEKQGKYFAYIDVKEGE